RHQFTRAVPTSQCMSCHMHQPNSFVNTYLGYTMWDYESDAELLWPKKQKYPTEAEKRASLDANPEGAAVRGLWSDEKFLENNIEIECQDCHGTTDAYTNLRTSGPAAPPGGTDLRLGTTPFGQRRFIWINGKLYQRSMLNPGMQWEVIQVKDSITPGNAHYNERSAYAKTIQRDGTTWGAGSSANFAHADAKITCYACHTSWMTSCSGCHLPQEQNAKTEVHHYEGGETRNYASYNPQVIRTDAFMLGVNGTTKGHRLAPVRSSSAVIISSTNALRD